MEVPCFLPRARTFPVPPPLTSPFQSHDMRSLGLSTFCLTWPADRPLPSGCPNSPMPRTCPCSSASHPLSLDTLSPSLMSDSLPNPMSKI